MFPQNKEEAKGLEEIHTLLDGNKFQCIKADFREYLENPDGDELIKKFLKGKDDEVLLNFLRGRKNDVNYAWETLKKNGEVKLIKYPELFPEKLPENVTSVRQTNAVTILKNRDEQGRRIVILDSRQWDVNKHSITDFIMYGNCLIEKLLVDEDSINNGIIAIHESTGLGFKHVKQYSIKTFKQLISIYWNAYPLKYKAFYIVKTPYIFAYAISVAKYFFPQKLKDRLFIWSTEKEYMELHKLVSPHILPKYLGGHLETEDAVDESMAI